MPRRGRGGKAKIPPQASRRSMRLAKLQGADCIDVVLSNEHLKEVDLFENISGSDYQQMDLDRKASNRTTPEPSIGLAELPNNNLQSEISNLDLLNADSKEFNNTENLDQERIGPACTQQSIGRAESKKSSKTNVSVPEDAEQPDNVLNYEDNNQNDLVTLSFPR